MQEEFEKKVQERVHTFGISPSPQVWDEVDAVLAKRKHRRVFIGWWILLGLVMAGGGVLFYQKDTILHNELNQRPVTTGDTALQNNIAKTAPATAPAAAQNAAHPVTPAVAPPANNNKTESSSTAFKNNNTATHFSAGTKNSFTTKNNNKGLQPAARAITAQQAGKTYNSDIKTTTPANDNAVAYNQPKPGGQAAVNTLPVKEPPTLLPAAAPENNVKAPAEQNTAVAQAQPGKTPAAPPAKNAAAQPITPKTIATKRHQWFFTVEGGTTQTIAKNGLFDQFNTNNPALYSQNYLALTSPSAYKYAVDKPGTGFHLAAGVSYQYKLSPRWRITAGAQVAYLSNTQKTGNYVKNPTYIDPTLNLNAGGIYGSSTQAAFYYQGSQQGKAFNTVNKAWQLQVPVNVSYVINPRAKTKFLLEGGVSFTRTLNSRWLIPDTRYEVLYYNKSLLNNTLLGWQAGPSMELYNRLQLGLRYGQSFTAMAKSSVAPKLYWQNISMYAAIPLNIHFKKTKK